MSSGMALPPSPSPLTRRLLVHRADRGGLPCGCHSTSGATGGTAAGRTWRHGALSSGGRDEAIKLEGRGVGGGATVQVFGDDEETAGYPHILSCSHPKLPQTTHPPALPEARPHRHPQTHGPAGCWMSHRLRCPAACLAGQGGAAGQPGMVRWRVGSVWRCARQCSCLPSSHFTPFKVPLPTHISPSMKRSSLASRSS